MTPRQSIEALCRRRGEGAVVDECLAILRGADPDPEILLGLAGPAARPFLTGEPRDDGYWLRVWATRGLLWAWDGRAVAELRLALVDDSWRVREMALKVIARHRVDDLLDDASELRMDPVPRVREASARATAALARAVC